MLNLGKVIITKVVTWQTSLSVYNFINDIPKT